jgi:hypothetical protein
MKYVKSIVVLLALVNLGCRQEAMKDYLPESTGPLNEVLVVAKPDLMESEVGETLKSYLQQRQLGLGVDEPVLDVRVFDPSLFKGAILRNRNVVVLELDTISRAHLKRNLYSEPQHIAVIKGRTKQELIQNIDQLGVQMVDSFRQSDLIVAQDRFKRSLYTEPRLKKLLGINLTIPSIYRPGVVDSTFIWIDRPVENGTMNLLIYPLNQKRFLNRDQFLEEVIAVRDSVGKARVPGPEIPGITTFMKTETVFRPYVFAAEVGGFKAAEIRGMWEIDGYPMAGPFVSYIVNDTINNRKLMLEGFVFAPNKEKRDYLFELESIIKTLTIYPEPN